MGGGDLKSAGDVERKGVGIVWGVGMVCIWLAQFSSSGSIECESSVVRRGLMLACGSARSGEGVPRYFRFRK